MQIKGFEFENITYRIDLAEHKFSDLLESEYISNILLELASRMGNKFYNYEFLIYSRPAYHKKMSLPTSFILDKGKRKQIIIYISDELKLVPEVMALGAFAVFKHRLPSGFTHPNIFPLPVGYNKTTEQQVIVAPEQRNLNVFFFGQLSKSRIGLYKSLANVNWMPDITIRGINKLMKKRIRTNFDSVFPNSFIRFTGSFGLGFGSVHYAKTLYDSKIALCPAGNLGNTETFRHFEAMRAGNIVITTPMPKFSFYTDSPMIVIDNWSQLSAVVNNLLKDPQRMKSIHEETLNWWATHFEEKAVASYMAGKIFSLEKQSASISYK